MLHRLSCRSSFHYAFCYTASLPEVKWKAQDDVIKVQHSLVSLENITELGKNLKNPFSFDIVIHVESDGTDQGLRLVG